MYEKGVRIEIGGKDVNLVFTLAALLQIGEKFGGLDEMAAEFNGPTIEEGDDEATIATKQKEQAKANMATLAHLPWLVAVLATQGELLNDPKAEPITPEWVGIHLLPKDAGQLMQSVNTAIAIGMATEVPLSEGKTDPVLEELDRKNVKGAEVE